MEGAKTDKISKLLNNNLSCMERIHEIVLIDMVQHNNVCNLCIFFHE